MFCSLQSSKTNWQSFILLHNTLFHSSFFCCCEMSSVACVTVGRWWVTGGCEHLVCNQKRLAFPKTSEIKVTLSGQTTATDFEFSLTHSSWFRFTKTWSDIICRSCNRPPLGRPEKPQHLTWLITVEHFTRSRGCFRAITLHCLFYTYDKCDKSDIIKYVF